MYTFIIDGDPVPWAAHGGYGRRSYDKRFKEKIYYRLQLNKQFKFSKPIEEAVKVDYVFKVAIPVSLSKIERQKRDQGMILPTKKPDTTNLVKLAEDTLKGIVIKDDNQVVEITAKKIYSLRPQTIITLEVLG